MNLDPDLIAHAIDLPLIKWPGNCAGVAGLILNHGIVEGKSEYGFYLGRVEEGTRFAGKAMIRHGWIRLPDNQIYDPTRWVFEGDDPYIYVDWNDSDYDRGMRSVRTSDAGNETLALEFLDLYDSGQTEFDFRFIMRVGNTFPEHMPGIAGEVYEALNALGHAAVIPIDFWEEVME